VLLSSVNVLGTRNLDPATEDLPYRRSHDPAADVKIEAEQLALDYAEESGGAVTILRPGFIYGPGDRHNLPRLASAVARGKFAFIGSRHNVVPIVHVQDVVQAVRLAGATPAAAGRVYHVTDGSRTTIGEFVDYVAERLGCPAPQRVLAYALPYLGCVLFEVLALLGRRGPAPINRAGLRFLGTSRYVDTQRAQQELGYRPAVSYREGVAAALDWIKEHSGEHLGVSTSAP
jgi:nucleoside-diphosphate-sugar epimerase